MNTVELIDGLDYPEDKREPMSTAHQITAEILTRLQQLDEVAPGNESLPPGGLRMINRLAAVARKERRAYRLILDMVGDQKSFSDSLEELAARHQNSNGHPTTRQAWLQNAQADVDTIKMIWPEVGSVMSELLKRRI